MNKSLLTTSVCLILFGAGIIGFWSYSHGTLNNKNSELERCHQQLNANVIATSSIALLPANVPDRTADWKNYSLDQYFSLNFKYPKNETVTVETGMGDAVLRRIHIGKTIILEAVSGGTDGTAGENAADYERIVYNSYAQMTKPDWSGYISGYSQEKIGQITLYSFHSNVFEAQSGVPQTSSGLPLRGVIFDPANNVDWLVYFSSSNDVVAYDMLGTLNFAE